MEVSDSEIRPLPKDSMVNMYRKMLEIRQFEEWVGKFFAEGEIPGLVHRYIGEEAVAVGTCTVLRKDDYILSGHRGHGHTDPLQYDVVGSCDTSRGGYS